MAILPPVTLADELKKDIWVHIGGLIAIAIGLADHFFSHPLGVSGFGDTTDILFVVGGLAAQGVKIVNGSAVQAATAAAAAISTIATQIAQSQALAAEAAAVKVTDTAAATASDLKAPGG